jgi:hypothetical protein
MKKLLRNMALTVCGVAVFLLSGCTAVAEPQQGATGQSAYEFWLLNYAGADLDGVAGISEADFLLYIKGDDGRDGNNGSDGDTPIITVDADSGCWAINGVVTTTYARGQVGEAGAVPTIQVRKVGDIDCIWVDRNGDGEVDEGEYAQISGYSDQQALKLRVAVLESQAQAAEDRIVELEQQLAELLGTNE